MEDTITVRGAVKIELNGSIIVEKDNLIVTTGKNFLTVPILSASASPMTHMAIGSGTTAAALTDTTLETEITRQAFTTASVTANVATINCLYAAGTGTGTITEAGLLNAAVAGTLLSRVVFTAIPKGALDTLSITWTVTVG